LILDTNALSAFVNGEPEIGTILRRQNRAAIPVIVLGEFRYGIMASKHRKTYEEWLEVHLRRFDLLPITVETTLPYASLRAAQTARSTDPCKRCVDRGPCGPAPLAHSQSRRAL
jgi:tRNA(fMet)-specific endonuclease VapC